MKKNHRMATKALVVKIFFVGMLVGTMNLTVLSQTRIRFARGESSATVTGTLPASYTRSYVVGARRGQMMTVHLRAAGYTWLDIGGNDVGDGITIECRSTDDYIITVHNDNNYATRYTLFVGID